MIPRPFFSTCFLALASFSALCANAEPTADTLNHGLTISHDAGTEHFHVQWWGQEQTYYFIEVSEDLMEWELLPTVERGIDDPAGLGLESNAPRLFFRLILTDDPENHLRSHYDTPAGELPDWWQILHLGQADYDKFADTSGDGNTDLYAYENQLDPHLLQNQTVSLELHSPIINQ
ncbi:MAG: hypothetical protein JJT75_14425 [Opitutales bacterium]|nr:hypothetical protein [Opitutales bacterium]MCH8541686.1 hypothetical protein [Opitutales bacterium]